MSISNAVKFDMHTHHERCGHAEGSIRDYIEAAIEHGLDIVGISDHSPFFYSEKDQLYPNIAMKKSAFQHYVQEILELQKEYKEKITVLLGVEADFFPEYIGLYRTELGRYPFDYIIGSVHFTDGESIFEKSRWDNTSDEQKLAMKELYYQLIAQSAKSGLFQILGHIDAMKTFYHPFSKIETKKVDRALKVIAEQGVAIEVNTSGPLKGCDWYPSDEILERAHYFDVDVTFGSDAHIPERTGDQFQLVQDKLKQIGFKNWCYFKQQEKFYVPL